MDKQSILFILSALLFAASTMLDGYRILLFVSGGICCALAAAFSGDKKK